jgi:hypothetical protein
MRAPEPPTLPAPAPDGSRRRRAYAAQGVEREQQQAFDHLVAGYPGLLVEAGARSHGGRTFCVERRDRAIL